MSLSPATVEHVPKPSTPEPASLLPTSDPDRQRVLWCGSQKGGTGRTTTLSNLAYEAARLGARVLMIDADPAWVLTEQHLGIHPYEDPDNPHGVLSDLIDPDVRPGQAAELLLAVGRGWELRPDLPWTQGGTLLDTGALALIPGWPLLSAKVAQYAFKPAASRYLARALRGVSRQFDLVLIDSGSTADPSAYLCVEAAGGMFSVSTPEDGGVKGTVERLEFLSEYARQTETETAVVGVIVTKYGQYALHKESVDQLRAALAEVPTDPVTQGIQVPALGRLKGWSAGPSVWDTIQPQSAAVLTASHERRPVASSLQPGRDRQGSRDRFLRREVLPYTRNAIRLLQLTGTAVLPQIVRELSKLDLPELWTGPAKDVP